jgi:hypothetical protein
MAKSADEMFDEAPTADALFDKTEDVGQKLTDVGGVKRLELHKVAKADPEAITPEESTKADALAKTPAAALPKSETEIPRTAKEMSDGELLKAIKDAANPHTATGALVHGGAKGQSMGFADELYGKLAGGLDERDQDAKVAEMTADAKRRGEFEPNQAPDLPQFTSYQLKREGQPTQTVVREMKHPNEAQALPTSDESYRANRDAMRADMKTAEKEHPGTFAAGELGGSFLVPLPGTGKAKGLAKVGKYALQGAGVGAVSGLGNSEADASKGDAGGALLDTAKSGLGGAAVGGLLGYGASKLDPALEKMAARRAFKALDPYMSKLKETLGPDVVEGKVPVSDMYREVERLGGKILDENIIPEGVGSRWANTEKINENAVKKLEEAGVLKGAAVDHAADELAKQGKLTPASMGALATKLENEAHQAGLDANQPLKRQLEARAADIRKTIVDRAEAGFTDPAAMSLQEAERLKTRLQNQVDYGAPLENRTADTIQARLAKEHPENIIESHLGPDELEHFKALKDRYGDLRAIAEMSGHGALRSFRNQSGSLGAKHAASVAAHAAGGAAAIPLAVAAGAGHEIANHRGSAAVARTLRNAARNSTFLAPAASEGNQEEAGKAWHSLTGSKDDEEQQP